MMGQSVLCCAVADVNEASEKINLHFDAITEQLPSRRGLNCLFC